MWQGGRLGTAGLLHPLCSAAWCPCAVTLSTTPPPYPYILSSMWIPYWLSSREQVLKRRYGKEADIWSCGVILYILLSGVPPFWGETEQQIFDAVAKGHIDFKTDPWPNVSSEAKDAVRVMLQQASLRAACKAGAWQHAECQQNG